MSKRETDLGDISAEITGISMIVSGLSLQLEKECDSLSAEALQNALFGVSSHLDRISEDLDNCKPCRREVQHD